MNSQCRVREQRAGQQTRLAEHLEAVADAEHQPAFARELRDLLHDRRKTCDRAAAEVIAIGEPTGDNDGVDALKVSVAVPEDHRLADAARRKQRIDVVTGPREANDAELHRWSCTPSTIS